MSTHYRRLPYGLSSFREVRKGDFAFVDKTRLIEVLERMAVRFPLFLRPRRFGKTLVTTMLMEYYQTEP
ncbi:AAA family ATPase [uncultured Sutterella sp.]|uniref:AAA family ATPase n=1 Tax=uncultured Sutterella sp. TaxID=286133 RepID=UPI0025F9FA7B|nr:AAA family ATPase [uncultured Sutterella sp.]